MENLNLFSESTDSNDNRISKDELIEIFETNEEVLSKGLNALVFKLKIGDYEEVFLLLKTIASQMEVTETMVEMYLTDEYGYDSEEDTEDDDFFDLPNRLN